ncbi:MAG: glycosyltransferase family 8 protein [Lachnospiraceae bacterium]|nr:glycosyltransferase family 8 protein [Lachnospiraceae bacterium]
MNIVYIATDSYTSMLGISMLSLINNSKDLATLDIYILSPDLTDKSKKLISGLVKEENHSVHYIDISDFNEKISFSFSTSGFHPIVLARLFLGSYLPAHVKTILYLDCDVIVHGSLLPLEAVSVLNCAFAAVPELCMPEAQKKRLGLSKNDPYFNAGVLLINLQYWRSHQMHKKFLDYYSTMRGKLLYNDQDILNHCCRGNILELSHRYNLSPGLPYFPRYFIKKYQPAYYCSSSAEYYDILKQPSIIHFLGEERPWMHGNFNYYRKIYNYYKSISPWKNEPTVKGREFFLFCYHILNCITLICPWFRQAFTRLIGIHYYTIAKKK